MNKNTIGTLTFHGVLNHGAVLQAYALQKFLVDQGYPSEIINYKPWYFVWQVFRPAKSIKNTIIKINKYKKFSRFDNIHIAKSKKRYISSTSLSKAPYKTIVVGSDQVWNKKITNGFVDDGFILRFYKGKKIGYAVSSGKERVCESIEIKSEIRKFSSIMVRESSLKRELDGENINSNLVLDPTLIISDYDEITYSNISFEGDYIFSYEVSTDETRELYEKKLLSFKMKTGMKVIHVGDKKIDSADVNITEIGPNDWLFLLKNAKYVLTNSFHGVCFSLNFRKLFVMISHVDEKRNNRPVNLLKLAGLEGRFISLENEVTLEKIEKIEDYSLLLELVDNSRKLLISSLEE